MTEDILNAPIHQISAPADADTVHIAVLIDESGSMAGCAADTIKNLNAYIDEQATSDKPVMVSIYTFNGNTGVKTRYANTDAKKAEHLGLSDAKLAEHLTYRPNGGTPLYDAIGETIQTQEADTATLVVILTDGGENASREFRSLADIQTLIKAQEEKGWTFVFLMAGLSRQMSEAYASSIMGRDYAGATMSYAKGNEEIAVRRLAASTDMWAGSARGMKAYGLVDSMATTQGFFSEEDRTAGLEEAPKAQEHQMPKAKKSRSRSK